MSTSRTFSPLRLLQAMILTGIFVIVAVAQQSSQPMDEDFARAVKEWTTRPEFMSPLVDHLPKVAGIPTPKDYLGYHIGEPKRLTATGKIYGYYRALAAASPRLKVLSIGKTDEGRECLIIVIGGEDAIRALESHREALGQLADPRNISEARAQEIIGSAKPIYHLMAGLHSGETGPPEMLMELAYRLVADESPLFRLIREQVIVSMTPVAEPDGRDRYVDWYYRHKTGETSEQDSAGGPPYWGKYIFHDNNRDTNYSQVTMRNLLGWYLQWHPPIMHDLHESVPFLYTFSGQSPQQPGLDPIVYGELPWFANFEMAQMIRYGMPGVWTHAFVDMWSPGYLAFMSSNHNGLVRMYETFGNGGANTMKRQVAPLQGGAGQTSREWYRPLPPYREVEWSLRNNTNYSQTAVLSALELTAKFPRVILENFYRKSRNSIEAGKNEAPHGYVIPPQADMTRVRTALNQLRTQGIEVGRATAEIRLAEGTFPVGSYVIKRNQPYGRLAKILIEKQNFPDPSLRTYDDTGWTLGLMTRTKIVESADKAILDIPVELVDRITITGTVGGKARPAGWIIPNLGSNNQITLRYRLKRQRVLATEKPYAIDGREYPAGSMVVVNDDRSETAVLIRSAIESLGLEAIGLATLPTVGTHEVDLPRLAVYSTWGNTQEVGWIRHALDQFEVGYDLIYKERVRQGGLRAAYDLILIPNQGRSGKGLVFDIEPRDKPLAYTRTAQFQTHGEYGSSEDITGGMGLPGVIELEKFTRDGGLLVTLGQASFFPAEFGLTRRIEAGRPSPQFYAPGPIVEAEVLAPTHPIFYGYDEKVLPVRYANGPLLSVPERDKSQILMQFTGTEKSVLSGLMRGAGEIKNRPAIVEVPVERGRVIMFATNPCYRWQNHGEFQMLFNTILHHNDLRK
jgi:hypothetical protein